MRHLHFTQSLEPLQGGGLGSSTVALHRRLLARGVASTLCSTCGSEPQNAAEHCHEFKRIPPGALYYAPELKCRAPDLVRNADVIHGHGLYVGTNFVLGREARRQDKPLVYHVHGMFEPYILQRSRWKKRLVHLLFEDANFHHARLWRALTPKEAEQIRACGVDAPVVIAPNGLDTAEFPAPKEIAAPINTPQIPALRKDRRRLLFLGRIHPKKGLDMLLNAWARLNLKTREWELVIAGPDEQGWLARIQDQARSVQVQPVFTGPVTGESKLRLLHSADAFVLPSYSEGFPMAVLEALACRVPVVATRACNFPDLSAAQAGWECEPTVDSLSETLRQALEATEAERRQRGENGRCLVETHYSWDSVINKLADACKAHCI